MPAVLQQMMRHTTISTTLEYSVGRDAQTAADVIHDAYRQAELGNRLPYLDTKTGTGLSSVGAVQRPWPQAHLKSSPLANSSPWVLQGFAASAHQG